MPKVDKSALAAQVEAEFQEIERQVGAANPGVADVLNAYGQYDSIIQQYDAYLTFLDPKLLSYSSDSSI